MTSWRILNTRAKATIARPCLLALGIGLAVSACRDVSAPTSSDALRSGQRPSFTFINAPGRVTVSPDSMHGWVLYDDQAGVACSDTTLCILVSGPTGAPSGTGSAELAVLSSAGGKALIIPDYAGVRLDQVTALRYSTYRQTTDNGNNLAIALQLNVDYDLTDASSGYQGRLVYEPYQVNGGQVLQSAPRHSAHWERMSRDYSLCAIEAACGGVWRRHPKVNGRHTEMVTGKSARCTSAAHPRNVILGFT
jgi:hypothetical protein